VSLPHTFRHSGCPPANLQYPACFNATTGDIENAPAIDNLPTFKIIEKPDGIYITANSGSDIKASRRKPKLTCRPTKPESVVVIGGGSGTVGAVEGLREGGFKGSITIIGSEGYLPIDRTKLSKALIPDPDKIALRDQAWFDDAGITTVGDKVDSVDFLTKIIITASGSTYPYSKLILATGGTPKRLPMEGFKELENIFVLRTIPHVKEILAAIGDKGKKIVIIGSSFIGMEVAKATSQGNDVTVVGMEGAPMERVMGKKVGEIFQKQLEDTGVKFRMNASVEKALPSANDPKTVGAVQLKSGEKLDADLVILGVGVAPQTTYLADNASVKLLDDKSLKVDEHYRVENLPDVYAIGDIATYPYHGPGGNGNPTRIEHWNVAMNSGRAAAQHILDPSAPPKPFIPIYWSALGAQLRYCGNSSAGFDDVVLQGSPDEGKFAAFYTKGDEVIAVASMQLDPVMTQCSELMRRGKMPGKKELEAGVDVLKLTLPAEVTMGRE
jgi:NADPH-dependent 2,4-dienoyl-CoA reductase/sulfur reductase-like enzyme